MANGIQNVTKHNPCRICNGTDWCGLIPTEYGYLNLCMRSDQENDVIGRADGKTYHYIKTTASGNKLYESVEQIIARQQIYKAQKGTSMATSYVRKELVYENLVKALPNDKLDMIYRDLLSMLVLEPEHEQYLRNESWPDALIQKNLICSFPEDDYYRYHNKSYTSNNLWRKELAKRLVAKYGDLTGVPGAYQKAGQWTFYGLGGIIFPLYDANGYIYRLRVRIDRQYLNAVGESIDKKKYDFLKKNGENCRYLGKYHNFTSYKEDKNKIKDGIVSNLCINGCEASNNLGFYMQPDLDDNYLCYITEGEKKGIIGNYLLQSPFISVPGVNSYSKLLDYDCFGKRPIDYLKEMGTQLIVIAFDADKALNVKVLESERNTVKILREEGFNLAVANWNISQGKGLDDLLTSGGKPSFEFI